ncbi:amidase [Agromyces luteolus]|uniref:Amidase n=1 Tax=Agromyces luteolus TaxID=88373 RepID=A0A7C9LDG5_9MICO|nr:amidase [Agromyces luteolus]MUN07552.1 amidase [Agromyces luteolus]GLK29565.1 amidase [Agromyces luteolus]
MTSASQPAPDPAVDATSSAADLAAAFRTVATTPVAIAEDALARIARLEPVVNAFSDHDPDQVRADAAASADRFRRGAPLGELDGVPVTVKENMLRAGVPARSGSAASAPVVPEADSPIVARLREAGAVILGSTTMPDWGMLSSGVSSLHGITRSPLDPALTVGGSSAGAGAAAAAGLGPIHLGTDIGGSVRFPAAWLGLVGLKPSAGRVPIDPPYLGRAAGPIGRRVADLAAAMAVVTRPDVRDHTSLPYEELDWTDPGLEVRGLRIAVHADAGAGLPVDPEVAAAVRSAAERFAAAGADVVELAPFLDDGLLGQVDLFWRVRFRRTFDELPPEARDRVLPYIARWVAPGAGVSGTDVLAAYDDIGELRHRTVLATAPFDAVLSPVAPMAAFPAERPMPWGEEDLGMAHIAFTLPYNMSGQPAVSINAGRTADGRAIALQVVGPRFADVRVLALAAWWERERPADAAVPPAPVGS